MKKKTVLYLIFIIIFLFAICKESFCILLEIPQRIISLGPSLTEEIYLLGAENKLIGVTTYCQRPLEAQKKEKIGTVVEVNLEKVVSLKPDLVLATPLTNLRQVKKLKDLGIKVVVFPSAKNFPQICAQFLQLGRMIGKERKSAEIIWQTKDKVNTIRESVENLPPPKVFVQIGAKPLFTVTKDSFIHNLIEFAGGINIMQNLKSGLCSREKILKENPDCIIISTMGIVGEKEKEIWQKYKTLNAVKNNRIYVVDSYKICSPTPASFVKMLEEMVNILHG